MTLPLAPELRIQSLFLQHAPLLQGFVLGLLGDRTAAEDVFQETFLAVVQGAASYDPQRDFLAWVRGVARNKVLEYWRRQGAKPRLVSEDFLEEMITAAEQCDLADWQARRTALARCLEQLAPRARQIVELRYAEIPLVPASIAQQLGWTVNAVNVALSRARHFLQTCTERTLRLQGEA
jgi:RNA polymerase sigma-70 factor, ECF subfamily